jgi:hypothetical protein
MFFHGSPETALMNLRSYARISARMADSWLATVSSSAVHAQKAYAGHSFV